jgi:hypothetical protein
LQSDSRSFVISLDKTPAGERVRRFNAPVIYDFFGIMVDNRTATREIVIRIRNNYQEFIADTMTQSQTSTNIQYIVEGILIMVDNRS